MNKRLKTSFLKDLYIVCCNQLTKKNFELEIDSAEDYARNWSKREKAYVDTFHLQGD